MSIRILSHLLLTSSIVLTASAQAVESLMVNKAEQPVEFRSTGSENWQPIKVGSSLAPPVEVRTGAGGSALLNQSDSSYTMKESTHLGFEASSKRGDGLISKVKQWVGTAFYKIERQPDTFSVETPFIVSTVKGTQFVIVTTDADSFVTLTEGSLEILDIDTGDSRLVAPGEIVGSSSGGTAAKTYSRPAPAAASPLAHTAPAQAIMRTNQSETDRASVSRATVDSPVNAVQSEAAFEKALTGIDQVRTEVRVSREQKVKSKTGSAHGKSRAEIVVENRKEKIEKFKQEKGEKARYEKDKKDRNGADRKPSKDDKGQKDKKPKKDNKPKGDKKDRHDDDDDREDD